MGKFEDEPHLPPLFEGMENLSNVRPIRHTPQPTKEETPALDWPKLAPLDPPPRQWAIKGWFGFGHVTLLVGQGGIGKTLIAQQMASSLALGREFVGEVEKPLKCLMWACEDDHDELWRRQIHLARWCKAGLEEFHENLVIIPRQGLENTLVSTEFGKLLFTPLIAQLSEQAQDLKAEVIILDNVGQTYGGGENDRHCVTAFLNTLVGALPGRAIMLLAHPSRSAGSEFSGSSAWENVARTRLYLGSQLPDTKADPDQEPNLDERYLCRRKSNYSNKDWRRFTYEDGVLVPEAVEDNGGLIGHLKDQHAEKVIVEALQKLTQMGIVATEGQRSPQYLPRLIIEYKLGNGQTRPELASAMRRLLTDGKLAKAEVGQYSNRSPRLGLVLHNSTPN